MKGGIWTRTIKPCGLILSDLTVELPVKSAEPFLIPRKPGKNISRPLILSIMVCRVDLGFEMVYLDHLDDFSLNFALLSAVSKSL